MAKFYFSAVLAVVLTGWAYVLLPSYELKITPLITLNQEVAEISVSPVNAGETISVNVHLSEIAEIWLSLNNESGQLLSRNRLRGQRISHQLNLARYSGKTFLVKISYVLGGTLYSSRIEKFEPVAGGK